MHPDVIQRQVLQRWGPQGQTTRARPPGGRRGRPRGVCGSLLTGAGHCHVARVQRALELFKFSYHRPKEPMKLEVARGVRPEVLVLRDGLRDEVSRPQKHQEEVVLVAPSPVQHALPKHFVHLAEVLRHRDLRGRPGKIAVAQGMVAGRLSAAAPRQGERKEWNEEAEN